MKESRLRGPINFKNGWQVTVFTVRITKLFLLYTYLTLDFVSDGNGTCWQWFPTRMYRESSLTCQRRCYQQFYVEQWPNFTHGGYLGTSGYPKGRKSYGGGGLVRRPGLRLLSSASSINGSPCAGLEGLKKANKKNKNLTNNKLIHIVSNKNILILAYELIKSIPGNSTPGASDTTLDKIDLNWFENASKKLLAGKYKFKPSRRVLIPKPDFPIKKRALTISSPRDKIIQKAILLVLEAIYEPSFLDYSHGSRPKKGTHTALKYIKYKFKETKWCIEADIESNFPNINHKILLALLKKRITCSKFLSLTKSLLKAGYVSKKKFFESDVGLFQGNITSPTLNNVYLHELDVFMDNLISSFNLGKSRRKNPKYRRFSYLMEKAAGNTVKLKGLRKQRRKVHSKDPFDPKFKRMCYVRYVDDFLVGVIGSRATTVELKNKIGFFLKNNLKLKLSPDKTVITQFSKHYIFFLGTLIKGTWEREKRLATQKKNGISRKVKITGRTVLKAPIKLLFKKATINKFFKKRNEEFVPTFVGRCINLDHSDILRYYNSVIHGILNYYSFTNNHKSLGSLIHGLKFSCARTLALKYKLRYASKVFKKFGSTLRDKRDSGETELFIPKTFKALKIFKINVSEPDDAIFSNWNNKLTRSNLFKQCLICGNTKFVEMHHIRKIRDLKSKYKKKSMDFFTMQMAAVNRKQIPLCSEHHKALHQNSLTQAERELFKQNIKSLRKS